MRKAAPKLGDCLEKAKSYKYEISQAKNTGKKCRKQAIWIGLERQCLCSGYLQLCSDSRPRLSDKELFQSKHMVETPEQAQMGLQRGAFLEGEYICLQNITSRICAPSDETTMCACIFWTKTSSSDVTPTWDKVVSSFFLIFMLQAMISFSLVVLSTTLAPSISDSLTTMKS